jgi:membrane-associated protein
MDFSEMIIQGVLTYGAPALALVVLAGSLGIPMPVTLLMVAAGAFARRGLLDWSLAAPLVLLGGVIGDSTSYLLGRYGWRRRLRRLDGSALWHRAQATFGRRGGLAILLTHVVLMPLCAPVTLIAGRSRYAYRRFLAYDVVGVMGWVMIYGGLGYLFADRWETIAGLVGNIGSVLIGALILGGIIYLASRRRARVGDSAPRLADQVQ